MVDPACPRPQDWVVLRAGVREFSVNDVLRAADFRGELEPRRQLLLSKVACQQHAAENQLEPETEQLQALADKFRYDRDLITSEETEAWLAVRSLDQASFTNHLMRTYWHGRLGESVNADQVNFADPAEADGHLIVEMLLGGGFVMMTQKLAWRLAALQSAQPQGSAPTERVATEREHFFERSGLVPDALEGWLLAAGGDPAWFEEMLALEAAYGLDAERIVTPDQLTRALRTRRLALMRLTVEEIEFDTVEAAREAVLCVREDNLSMREVAAESGYSYAERDFLLEEQPEEWQTALISTPEGTLTSPIQDEEVVRLFRVVRKTDPSIDDPEVRDRLEELVLDGTFQELCGAQAIKILV